MCAEQNTRHKDRQEPAAGRTAPEGECRESPENTIPGRRNFAKEVADTHAARTKPAQSGNTHKHELRRTRTKTQKTRAQGTQTHKALPAAHTASEDDCRESPEKTIPGRRNFAKEVADTHAAHARTAGSVTTETRAKTKRKMQKQDVHAKSARKQQDVG